ncbi:MAG: DegV family protein [Anaerolinea sp.]|nr:DegV family protein [Anaerolinea sp.]
MQIVTDRAADLAPEFLKKYPIEFAPLRITLNDKTYSSGVDLDGDTFYRMLSETDAYPTTSQPSAGEFAELYRQLAKKDPEILSIHVSSGLSGTWNSARSGAEMVPEAHVTVWDSKTLSCPLGWQVEAAAKAVEAGWSLERILTYLGKLREKTNGMFTLDTLKYLLHGGRISHISGLVASLLNIKPVISVEKERGTYIQVGRYITLKRAIYGLADIVAGWYGEGTRLRVQPLHGNNLEGVAMMCEQMEKRFQCVWETTVPIAPVLGAHTGPGLVGMAVAPVDVFEL